MPGSTEPERVAHHEAFERGKTHGRIDAAAFADRRQRAAIAEMASHQMLTVGAAQQLLRAFCAVLMIDAVKSVAADSLLEPLVGTGIGFRR